MSKYPESGEEKTGNAWETATLNTDPAAWLWCGQGEQTSQKLTEAALVRENWPSCPQNKSSVLASLKAGGGFCEAAVPPAQSKESHPAAPCDWGRATWFE